MTETMQNTAMLRLLSWFSPTLPTGAFAYSSGLESAFAHELIGTKGDLLNWVRASVQEGAAWNDAVLCAAAWQHEMSLQDLTDLAIALAPGIERHDETIDLGDAFRQSVTAWSTSVLDELPTNCPLPIVVGRVARVMYLPLEATLNAFLHSYCTNQIQAALRLGHFGQRDGLKILAQLEPEIVVTAANAAKSTIDDLGSATLLADMMTLAHETQQPRIFKS